MNPYSKAQQTQRAEKVTPTQYQKMIAKKQKRSKYGAVKQTYNGYSYDSKLEAQYASQLDWEKIKGTVIKWERQHKIELIVNDNHVGNYYIDFKVWLSDGTIRYDEVKGAETQLWRLKWKLAKALNPDWNFKIIKKV